MLASIVGYRRQNVAPGRRLATRNASRFRLHVSSELTSRLLCYLVSSVTDVIQHSAVMICYDKGPYHQHIYEVSFLLLTSKLMFQNNYPRRIVRYEVQYSNYKMSSEFDDLLLQKVTIGGTSRILVR